MSQKYYLANHVEAAAMAIILGEMGHKDCLDGIANDQSGWYVSFKRQPPEGVIDGIMAGIRIDQMANPGRWVEAAKLHPNAVPVDCRSDPLALPALAEQMRQAALADVHDLEYQASGTKPLAQFRAEMTADVDLNSGQIRYAVIGTEVVTLVLSLRAGSPQEWNFSTSLRTNESIREPQRVPDDLAATLATTFIGPGYTEVEPKAVYKTIRHFINPRHE